MVASLTQTLLFAEELLGTFPGSHAFLAIARNSPNGFIIQANVFGETLSHNEREELTTPLFSQLEQIYLKEGAHNSYFEDGFGISMNSFGIDNPEIIYYLTRIFFWYLSHGPVKTTIDRYYQEYKPFQDMVFKFKNYIPADKKIPVEFSTTDLGIPTTIHPTNTATPGRETLVWTFHGLQGKNLYKFLLPSQDEEIIIRDGLLDIRLFFVE